MNAAAHNERNRVTEEASAWVMRLAEDGRTTAEQEAFEEWLAADPRHMDAYELASRTWADLAHVPGLSAAEAARALGARNRVSFAERLRSLLRPPVLAGAGLVSAMLLVGIVFGPRFFATEPQYETAIAEVAPVRLEDGSIVTLGARSAIDADFSDSARRSVTLRSGEAFFEIAHNPQRPFYVMAGDVAVRVIGTKFDVRRGAKQTVISVREGVVEVSVNNVRHRLEAGDQAVIEHREIFFVSRPASTAIVAVAPANVAAWREGRLDYTGTPVSELVADLNRYYAPGVEIASPEVGELRVTASFPADDAEGVIQDLGRLFPINVERRADGRYILQSQSGDAEQRR